ncbi:ammonium transporter [Argonema antarcticum]|uniref:ammonium transporter n=1 Tax=Argonema antarcticum TaxID=2942763 RepID=UPI00201115B8|nr:ammonium transporter [Argonema antarcticum]MCL1474771.1 ammonium transporter [Argonema antarcticum A004/B2]
MVGNTFAQDVSPSPSPSPTLSTPETASPTPTVSPTGVSPSPTASPTEAFSSPTASPTEAFSSPTGSPEASPSPIGSPEASPSPTGSPEVLPSPTGLPDAAIPVPVTPPAISGQEASGATAGPTIDTGDTAWLLISSALVLLMTPALAFFYGGLVRSRNVLNTMMMSLILMALVGLTWVLWGYSLAFAPNTINPGSDPGFTANPIIGSLKWAFLNGVEFDKPSSIGYAPTIPHQLFMLYNMMFAIITPALISGAIVERISFKAYFWFVLIWSTVIYSPLAHWVWGKGGWLLNLGALDFAGGTVVHISSGVSAVVAAYVLGPRKTYPTQPAAPHNVPYVLLGIGLLWFGWLGFNGGSAGGAGALAALACVTTVVASASGGLTWVIVEWVLRGKPTAIGIATGFLAGLVGITPAAGFVSPIAAILIGSITSICCFFAVSLRAKWQFDDSLDTYPVHGVGGTVGALLTGIFANKAVNSAGADGLLAGNPGLLWIQFVGVAATYVFAAVGTLIILKALGAVMALRVKPIAEEQGLDITEHGEEGYGEEFASGLSFTKE